jgi:N-dimethylarginine dimethylaminohydrolase
MILAPTVAMASVAKMFILSFAFLLCFRSPASGAAKCSAVHMAKPRIQSAVPGADDVMIVGSGHFQFTAVHEVLRTRFSGSGMVAKITKDFDFLAKAGWVRDWFPRFVSDRGREFFLSFGYHTSQMAPHIEQLEAKIKSKGFPVVKIDAFVEQGNVILTESGDLFISASRGVKEINEKNFSEIKNEIESKTGLRVHYVRSVTRESTGHVDMFMTYLGEKKILLARSENPELSESLEATAKQLKELGYEVLRVKNAGSDFTPQNDFGTTSIPIYSYTNMIVRGKKVFLPTYSDYFKSRTEHEVPGIPKYQLENGVPKPHNFHEDPLWIAEYEKYKADDATAIRALQTQGFEVIPIAMNSVIEKGGVLHCLTADIPLSIYLEIFGSYTY